MVREDMEFGKTKEKIRICKKKETWDDLIWMR